LIAMNYNQFAPGPTPGSPVGLPPSSPRASRGGGSPRTGENRRGFLRPGGPPPPKRPDAQQARSSPAARSVQHLSTPSTPQPPSDQLRTSAIPSPSRGPPKRSLQTKPLPQPRPNEGPAQLVLQDQVLPGDWVPLVNLICSP